MLERKQVEHMARLSKLRLSETEIEQFIGQLNQIVRYIEKLNELDTQGVQPATHALLNVNVFRPDQRQTSLDTDKALRNAPEREDSYFKVPRILD